MVGLCFGKHDQIQDFLEAELEAEAWLSCQSFNYKFMAEVFEYLQNLRCDPRMFCAFACSQV